MPISYVDQFVVDNLDSLLKGILNNSYIIREDILKDLPSDIVDSFINSYSSDTGKGTPIPIAFTFPANQEGSTYIVAQFKGSQEVPEDSSLGSYQGGIGSQAEGDMVKERLPVQVSGNTAYVTLTDFPYKVVSVKENSSYSYTKNDKTVTLAYSPFYSDGTTRYVHVAYSKYKYYNNEALEDKYIETIGINTVEGVTLDIVSTNINNLRCLYGIINTILIYLKSSLEDNYNINSPQVKVEGDDLMADFNNATDSTNGQRYFFRRFEISYKVTQTVSPLAGDKVDKLDIESLLKGS